MRYFGPLAEDVAIEVITIIDWAAEFLQLSNSPVPDIPKYLQSPFVMAGIQAQNPMPEDPCVIVARDIDTRTKSQQTWTHLCALLQFWTDEATVSDGIQYGGRRRPANPLVGHIRSVLNPFLAEPFKITWESIEAKIAWTRARFYFGNSDKTRFESEGGPSEDLHNPLENAMEARWKKQLEESTTEGTVLEFSSPSWAGTASHPVIPSGVPEVCHPTEAESIPPGFSHIPQKTPQEQEAVQPYRTQADDRHASWED